MNRKQKIIVSIVGITIVLLALLGITYAYYLTRIEGNTNTNSISITTADLKLAYDDGNEIITALNIIPNTTIAEKTFSVTNTGNSTIENYRVVLELASIEGIVPSVFKYPNDFEITLTCVSKNNTSNEVSGTCNGFTGTWNNESFEMQKNTIAEGIRHEYSLTIKYVDSGIDQSDDMGKNLNLKVQIYGETDTSTLNGTITGVDSTYAMKLNSKPKVSVLKTTENTGEYRYSFIGVEPGTHTLTLINKDGNVVSSETITINKGTETNVNGSTIIVKENQSTIHLTTNSSGSTLSSIASFNPYDNNTNTLAYHILNNSMNKINGTEFRETPITTPGKGVGNIVYTGYIDPERADRNETYEDEWFVYGEEISIDSNGYFKIKNVKVGQFVNDLSKAKGKYITTTKGYNTEEKARSAINNEISKIYKIEYISPSGILDYGEVSKISKNIESVLSLTKDDYGVSYYFRGGVTDNYVNFAGMCWKIVRIEGDGSIKIVLASQKICEQINSSDPTTAFIGTSEYSIDSASGIMYKFDDWFKGKVIVNGIEQDRFSLEEKNKIKLKQHCLGDVDTKYDYNGNLITNVTGGAYFYNSYLRLYKPDASLETKLTCDKLSKKTEPTKISTLSADEVIYAGVITRSSNKNTYLFENTNWHTLTPAFYNGNQEINFIVESDGRVETRDSFPGEPSLRPALSLIAGIEITDGEGTLDNPYVIE